MKNFKIFLLAFLLLIGFSPAFCAENAGFEANLLTRKLAKYPEVLVKYGKNEIKRVQAYELLKYHDLKDVDDAEFDDLLRSAVEEKIYSDIVVFFLEKYNVNPDDLNNYDLVVDTTYATPDEICELISKYLELWKEGKAFDTVWTKKSGEWEVIKNVEINSSKASRNVEVDR